MNKKTVLAVFAVIFLSAGIHPVIADTPAPNVESLTLSPNGQFSIRMVPDEGWGGYGPGEGIVFEKSAPVDREIWKVNFYSSEVILADDGRHLIAFGPWAMDMTDLAVSFYEEGRLLKEYRVLDLIDPDKVQRTVSHLFWKEADNVSASRLSEDQKTFTVRMIDGTERVFDVATGELTG